MNKAHLILIICIIILIIVLCIKNIIFFNFQLNNIKPTLARIELLTTFMLNRDNTSALAKPYITISYWISFYLKTSL